MRRLWFTLLMPLAAVAQVTCGGVSVTPSPDRAWLVGSSDASAQYRWTVNGSSIQTGPAPQLFLMHADGSAAATDGRSPLQADSVTYVPGRWGSGLQLTGKGTLSYARSGAVDFNEGTIEMWVAAHTAQIDASRTHVLFGYRATNGETMSVAVSGSAKIIYAGGTVRGQWESAYGASVSGWKPGEWHHVAFTYSAQGNFMRFYVDGKLVADTNEHHYWAPDAGGDRFTLGGASGAPADFSVDEVRVLSRPMTLDEVKLNAARADAPRNNEVWLSTAGLHPSDSVIFTAGDCSSTTYTWRGVPINSVSPPSTLLPPGSTTLDLSLQSAGAANCTWAVGDGIASDFQRGQGGTSHSTTLRGLSPDPSVVNRVTVRCDTDPDYALTLLYRSLPHGNPHFPRKGNLWGSAGMAAKGLTYASKIDLYLGANFDAGQIRQLRALNPEILVLTSINTVENSGLSEDYYLHDTTGRRIEVWPGTYRLNLTKPYVAEYQARFAYQTLLDAGLMADGCFFDNFFTTQSWLKTDIWGRQVQLDANEDGQPDDPAWLDAEWGKGVYHELETWRTLMPWALASGHLPRPPAAPFASIFNGDSIGFMTSDALENKIPFQNLWDAYNKWWEIGRPPSITMVETTPQDQISYGYSYSPSQVIPPPTLEFARTYYPNMRFGLGVTLMNDGYYAYEYGDTWHGNDWWYDELDFDLGFPLGAAERVAAGAAAPSNLVINGGFEDEIDATTWRLSIASGSGAVATMNRDTTDAASGSASAHITVSNAGDAVDWHVEFAQYKRSLEQGKSYDLTFSAKASAARQISVNSQKDAPDWRNYGLNAHIAIGTAWSQYKVTFVANATVSDARLQFWVGNATGQVWIDDVKLVEHPADIYKREFTNGLTLLNATKLPQTIAVGAGWKRLTGAQAPRHEYIVDDAGAAFSSTGNWRTVKYDTGEWTATGPFYHAWTGACHQLDSGAGTAQWDLALREDDTYTIDVWWAAAPGAASWTKRAVFEVVAGGNVVATTTLDQSTAGDQWHTIATVPLAMKDAPVVRVHSEGTGPLVADALHVRSAARYNDGASVTSVTLEPMDAIVLARDGVK